MARDLEQELAGWDGTYPPAWRPQRPGETLIGRIIGYSIAPNNYGGETRIATVERENGGGRVAVWLSNVSLLNLFAREKPRVGERVGLKFLDTVTTKSGRSCKRFHLIVDRPQADPDFTPLGDEEPDAEESVLPTWAASGSRERR